MTASTRSTASVLVPGAEGNILSALCRNGHQLRLVQDVADVVDQINITCEQVDQIFNFTPSADTYMICCAILNIADELGGEFNTAHYRVAEILRCIFTADAIREVAPEGASITERILRTLMRPGARVTVRQKSPAAPRSLVTSTTANAANA